MNKKHCAKNNQSGFTLVEVLVSLGIISILTLGIFSLLITSLKITSDNKFHLEAMAIANQKMEQIRNMPYQDVGTVNGSPNGLILDSEIIIRDGEYTVDTFVKYEDDAYDGTLSEGTDSEYDDYKIATVKISWQSKNETKNVTVFSKIIPKTKETSTGNGLLKIIVVDAGGNPVSDADIHIENAANSISINATSEVDGEFEYSAAPDFEGYEIIVTKSGYGVDRTYTRNEIIDEVTNSNPSKPHLTIIEGEKTEESFSIDLLGTLTINTIIANLPENFKANTDTGGEAQTNSRLAIDNSGYIYIVWQDYRQSSASKILAQKYNSSGEAQWPNTTSPEDQVISTANNTVMPDILVDNFGHLYITWHDNSGGNQEAYLVKRNSSDGSDIWGSEKKINTLADSADQSHPRVTLSEGENSATTTVVWQDDRDGSLSVYAQKFDSNGTKNWSPEKIANTNSNSSDQYDPAVITDSSDNAYIAWADNRNGDLDIYAAKYDSSGIAQWTPDNIKINTNTSATDQYSPDIAIDSFGYIYIAWADNRNGDLDIYAAKYDSSGIAQWTPDNIKINTDDSESNQYSPAMAIDSDNILYIAWTDEKNGDQDIYAQKYNSGGIAQWEKDLRVNINVDASSQYNPDIIVSPANNKPYVSWQDDRNGDLDIYITKFDSYGAASDIANVPLTIMGTKKIGENPVIYEYNKSYTTDAAGDLILNIEWDNGYAVTTTSSSYNIILSDPAQPIELLPLETRDVLLYLKSK